MREKKKTGKVVASLLLSIFIKETSRLILLLKIWQQLKRQL